MFPFDEKPDPLDDDHDCHAGPEDGCTHHSHGEFDEDLEKQLREESQREKDEETDPDLNSASQL